jgi:hypothetical protein
VGEHLLLALVVEADERVEGARIIAKAGVGVALLGWVGTIATLSASRLLDLLQRVALGRRVVGRFAFPGVIRTGLVEEGGYKEFLSGRSAASGVVMATGLTVALGEVGIGC